VGVGFLAVAFAGAPVWFPVAFAVVVLAIQYLVNPLIIKWLVPAVVIPHDGQRYATDHPLGEIVARRVPRRGRAAGDPGNRGRRDAQRVHVRPHASRRPGGDHERTVRPAMQWGISAVNSEEFRRVASPSRRASGLAGAQREG
jgi:hypothetical protein